MSSSAGPSDATKNAERRKSLGKYVKRMSSVFKRDKSSQGQPSASVLSPAPAAPSTPTPKTQQEEEPEQKQETTTVKPATTEPAASPAPAAVTTATPTFVSPKSGGPMIQELNRAALQQERARALFAKYGLTLESHEWISAASQPTSVQRVERPIRMRVHRFCHHCGNAYGINKVCSKCEHKRCKKCPRYPKRKTPEGKAEKEKEKEKEQDATEGLKKKKKHLTMTNRAGDERVYRPVKQRVTRTCHECHSYFNPPKATVCEQCQHVRCTKCPRDPAKLSKWPNGYPGDAEPESDTDIDRSGPVEPRRIWRKPRMKVRWECEECHSHFLEGLPRCPGCGHERCEKCTRTPLKKTRKEPQFDPDVIRAVEEKLRALVVDTSGAETT